MQLNVCRGTGYLLSFVYYLIGWHANTDSFPPGEVIFAQLACTLNDTIFFKLRVTDPSINKH